MLNWPSKGISTHELSETDNMRGAKLEVGILGVVIPLMDGVFSPYNGHVSTDLRLPSTFLACK